MSFCLKLLKNILVDLWDHDSNTDSFFFFNPYFRGDFRLRPQLFKGHIAKKVSEQLFDPRSSDAHLMFFPLQGNRLKTCLELNKPNTKGFKDQVGQILKLHKHQGLESVQKGENRLSRNRKLFERGVCKLMSSGASQQNDSTQVSMQRLYLPSET